MNTEQYWTSRATVRLFSDKEISDTLLETMIDKASHAPTTGNMQLYSVVVTRDPEMKNRLAPAHFSQPAMTGATVLLTFCADFNRFVKWCKASGAVPGYDNFHSFITSVLDTVIFAQQFVTIAEMDGLGCCYLGTTTYNAPQIADVLGLPARVVPVVTIALGWPDEKPQVSDRLPIVSIIHKERYHDPTLDEVKGFYSGKEALESSIKYVDENEKQSLAQVFTDVRYTKANNEYCSKLYRDFIESAGFEFPK